jgi:O-antigen/teichoic acid export membrane protein
LARMRNYAIVNIAAMIVLAIGVINAITVKEVWILSIAVIFLIVLTIYTITERKRHRQKQSQNQG